MNVVLVLLPLALGLGLLGLLAFMWAMRTGQFDDLDGAAHRVLLDDDVSDDTARPRRD
jgi:cbb3-type cytochrome oxidase maturation protein